jgi:hypothetical protein
MRPFRDPLLVLPYSRLDAKVRRAWQQACAHRPDSSNFTHEQPPRQPPKLHMNKILGLGRPGATGVKVNTTSRKSPQWARPTPKRICIKCGFTASRDTKLTRNAETDAGPGPQGVLRNVGPGLSSTWLWRPACWLRQARLLSTGPLGGSGLP